jgi:translation initiation factor IF-2
MTGYLQRLIDTTPGILAATPQPVVRSQSPIAQNDQRLALDPAADATGDVSADVSPAAFAAGPIAPVAQPAPRAPTPAAPMPQTAPPVAVQRFQAPSAAATAPPQAPASVAPSVQNVPPAKAAVQSGPALQAPPPRQESMPQISPVTIINQLADTARPSPPETRADLRTQAPVAKSDEPVARARPAPALDSTKPAATEKTATRGPDELAYVSPAERVFEALQQLPRPAPSRETAEAIPAAPDRSPAAPTGRPAREIPAREIRETIREIVREVASTAPAPPRDIPRLPKTAAEASVIGPLGSPYTAARRLALMLR